MSITLTLIDRYLASLRLTAEARAALRARCIARVVAPVRENRIPRSE